MTLFISPRIHRLIDMALEEDEVGLDAASGIFFAPEIGSDAAPTQVCARLVAKQVLRLCGTQMVQAVFERVDPNIRWTFAVRDGGEVADGEVIGKVEGPAISVLRAERTALNFLQRMSGIATQTARYVAALGNSPTRIVDTRKTLPGFRELDKYAVRCGGGQNHRVNLAGGVMLKDNHIAAAGGSIQEAVRMVRAQAPLMLKVEVEVTDFDELSQALQARADIIMFDNMSTEMMAEAVRRARAHSPEILLEASGNITLERLPELADIGLDYISSGALTHSVAAADISLKF